MTVNGIIFDVDGTLVDSLSFWEYYWQKLGDVFFGGKKFIPDEDTEKMMRTSSIVDGVARFYEIYKLGESADALIELTDSIYRNFYINEVVFKPGAAEFVKYCHSIGIKMCIASGSTEDVIREFLKKNNMEQYFSEVFTCAVLGTSKTFPDIYNTALEHLETPKDKTWVFEDSIIAVETAVNAGFPTVGIYDSHNFELDRVKALSTLFIDKDETLMSLKDKIIL